MGFYKTAKRSALSIVVLSLCAAQLFACGDQGQTPQQSETVQTASPEVTPEPTPVPTSDFGSELSSGDINLLVDDVQLTTKLTATYPDAVSLFVSSEESKVFVAMDLDVTYDGDSEIELSDSLNITFTDKTNKKYPAKLIVENEDMSSYPASLDSTARPGENRVHAVISIPETDLPVDQMTAVVKFGDAESTFDIAARLKEANDIEVNTKVESGEQISLELQQVEYTDKVVPLNTDQSAKVISIYEAKENQILFHVLVGVENKSSEERNAMQFMRASMLASDETEERIPVLGDSGNGRTFAEEDLAIAPGETKNLHIIYALELQEANKGQKVLIRFGGERYILNVSEYVATPSPQPEASQTPEAEAPSAE